MFIFSSFEYSGLCISVSMIFFFEELERMKERFAKLLLADDMSGSGKGVTTAVAISNAITNLYCEFLHNVGLLLFSFPNIFSFYFLKWSGLFVATVFGHSLRLEPLNQEKKVMWKKEMECLLAVCDHMVEFISSHSKKVQDDLPKKVRAKSIFRTY